MIGCEENFSPETDFEQAYSLTSIIRNADEFQLAFIVKSYSEKNNQSNYFYKGANIRLWHKDTVYIYKDSVVTDSKTNEVSSFYYLDNFKGAEFGDELEIEAMLTNGKRLKASCSIPTPFYVDRQVTATVIPPTQLPAAHVGILSDDDGYFITRMRIRYFSNDLINPIFKEIPLSYTEDNGNYLPNFPSPTKGKQFAYYRSAIDKTFELISTGIEDKSTLFVSDEVYVEILSLEPNLAAYYSAGLEENRFTVRLDESDYSNVNGGMGIFGALYEETTTIPITKSYIEAFGYQVLSGGND
jgi:hypothetical protein